MTGEQNKTPRPIEQIVEFLRDGADADIWYDWYEYRHEDALDDRDPTYEEQITRSQRAMRDAAAVLQELDLLAKKYRDDDSGDYTAVDLANDMMEALDTRRATR